MCVCVVCEGIRSICTLKKKGSDDESWDALRRPARKEISVVGSISNSAGVCTSNTDKRLRKLIQSCKNGRFNTQ